MPALVPASSGTLTDFFKEKGVALEPQNAAGLQGAQHHAADADRLEPGARPQRARRVRGDRRPGRGDGLYTSNAQVVVYKLVGDFDLREAISHGYIDSQQLAGWQSTDASLADFGGFRRR